MAKKGRTYKQKRRLTQEEIEQARSWLESAPMDKKPTIRQMARWLGVTRPSLIKSLGGWRGIQRGRPQAPEKPKLIDAEAKPIIEAYTTEVDLNDAR